MWLFLAFLLLPLIEIGLFILVGGWIGLWPTLALVILTAFAGIWLVRHQGAAAQAGLRRALQDLDDPSRPLADNAMILLAGALLVLPGFFTDALGGLLLIPPVRAAVLRRMARGVRVRGFVYRGAARPGDTARGEVIEGEYRELDPTQRPTHRPENRTRH